jgi:hypothetical protein
MTILTVPSLEQRLLRTVKEEAEARSVREWPQESVELCLNLLQQIRTRIADMHQTLEEILAEGVEARSFAREGVPILAAAEDRAASIRELIDRIASLEDACFARLLRVLRSLEKEEQAFRDDLAEALARVSESPPSMDWEQLKREADADFAAGRFVTFTTPEEMAKDLAGSE